MEGCEGVWEESLLLGNRAQDLEMQSSLRSVDLWTGKVQKCGHPEHNSATEGIPEGKRDGGKDIWKRKRKRGREAEKETDREQNAGKEKDLGIALGYRSPVPSTN